MTAPNSVLNFKFDFEMAKFDKKHKTISIGKRRIKIRVSNPVNYVDHFLEKHICDFKIAISGSTAFFRVYYGFCFSGFSGSTARLGPLRFFYSNIVDGDWTDSEVDVLSEIS